LWTGKRSSREESRESKKSKKSKKSKADDDSDVDEDVAVVLDEGDLEVIDSANIIPRGRRQAALRSGLARPGSAKTSSSSSSSSSSSGGRLVKKQAYTSDDEEAEF